MTHSNWRRIVLQTLANLEYAFQREAWHETGFRRPLSTLTTFLMRDTEEKKKSIFPYIMVEYESSSWWKRTENQQVRSIRGRERYMRSVDPIVGDFQFLIGNADIPRQTKDDIAAKGLLRLDSLSPMILASLLNSCKNGSYVNEELLEAFATRMLGPPNILVEFSALELSMVIESLGVLFKDSGYSQDVFPSFRKMVQEIVDMTLHRELEGSEVNDGHGVSNYVHALGLVFKLGRGYEIDDNSKQLLEMFLERMTKLDELEQIHVPLIAWILHGCANLGVRDAHIVDALCDELQQRLEVLMYHSSKEADRRATISIRTISVIMWSLGKLRYQHEGLLTVVRHLVIPNVTQFHDVELANLVYGFGSVGFHDEELIYVLGKECRKKVRMHSFEEKELAVLVYSFGELGLSDERTLSAFVEEIANMNRIVCFNEHQIANVVYGLAKMEVRNGRVFRALCSEIGRHARLALLDAQALANLIHGVGVVGYSDESFLSLLASETIRPQRLKSLSKEGVVSIISSFGKLGHFEKKCMKELLQRATNLLPDMNLRNLADLATALTSVKSKMDVNFIFKFVEPFLSSIVARAKELENIGEFVGDDVYQVCWALGELHYYDQTLMNRCIDQYLLVRESMGPLNMLMILHACGRLSHVHEAFLGFATQSLEMNYKMLRDLTNVTSALWALAVLNRLSTDLFEKLCSSLVIEDEREFDRMKALRLTQAWACLGSPKSNRKTDRICKMAAGEVSGKSRNASYLERGVEKVLDELNIAFTRANDFGFGEFLMKGDYPIALQLQGPSKFSINKMGEDFWLVGEGVLEKRIMERKGVKVVPVPYFKWQSMPTQGRKVWLQRQLSEHGISTI